MISSMFSRVGRFLQHCFFECYWIVQGCWAVVARKCRFIRFVKKPKYSIDDFSITPKDRTIISTASCRACGISQICFFECYPIVYIFGAKGRAIFGKTNFRNSMPNSESNISITRWDISTLLRLFCRSINLLVEMFLYCIWKKASFGCQGSAKMCKLKKFSFRK